MGAAIKSVETMVHKKTGIRFPLRSSVASFNFDKMEVHIKPLCHELCTKGWKRLKMSDWNREEIPAIPDRYTDSQFREYASKWGIYVAMEFLYCADIIKFQRAQQIIVPPRNKPFWESSEEQFFAMFGISIWHFADAMCLYGFNSYEFDILGFEKFLTRSQGYKASSRQSIKDFLTKKYGVNAANLISQLIGNKEKGKNNENRGNT